MTAYPDAAPSASGHICDEGLDTFCLELDSDQEGATPPARMVR